MHRTHRRILLVVFTAFFLFPIVAHAQSFTDSFENPTFDPFWTVVQQFGTASTTTELAHTGTQSLKLASTFGGQREIHLAHDFPSTQKGDFSIYFYDNAPGQETLYQKIFLYNSISGDSASLGTQDFDADCDTAQMYNYTTNVLQGPNGTCGIYPQTSTTNVSRTAGWHKLDINVAAGSTTFAIDSTAVFTASGDYSFDSVTIFMSGPFWRPNTVAYFDDFSFQTSATSSNHFVGYFKPLLNDGSALFQSERTIPVRFQLIAPDGSFVSNAVAEIHVFKIIETPTGAVDMSVDTLPSGSSNTGTLFRYDSTSNQYIYNLSIKGYSSGTYLLRTTIDDGSMHDVNFSIK